MTLENAIVNAILCDKYTVKSIHGYCCRVTGKRLSLVPIRMLLNEMVEKGQLVYKNGYRFPRTLNAWHR